MVALHHQRPTVKAPFTRRKLMATPGENQRVTKPNRFLVIQEVQAPATVGSTGQDAISDLDIVKATIVARPVTAVVPVDNVAPN